MEIYLDSANLEEIRSFLWFPLKGVTTNPTFVAKAGVPLFDLIDEILSLGIPELHCQVLGESTGQIVREGKMLAVRAPGKVFPKIPVSKGGIEAIRLLAQEGIKTTATAVYTVTQGLVAAKSGASFIAPYVNRLDAMEQSGVEMATELSMVLDHYGLDSQVLAASVKTTEQLKGLMLGGVHTATIGGDLLEQTIRHPLTDASIKQFADNWLSVFQSADVDAKLR